MNYSNDAVIVGWAHSPFGKLGAEDIEALIASVGATALAHAGVSAQDVDNVTVGVLNSGFSSQGFEAGLVSVAVPGLERTAAMRTENACATGSAALYSAMDAIAAGRSRIALVVGAEKMTATPVSDVGDILLTASYRKEEDGLSAGFAGIFGDIANCYFQKYGDKSLELAMIAAKNHANGMANPYAHMRKDLGVEFCNTESEKNPRVAGPLRRTDCSLISDGAAALVVTDRATAEGLQRAIGFRARAHENDVFPLSRRNPVEFAGARAAWSSALELADITLNDLDAIETHDCFTIAEMLEYEAMGLAAPGEGWKVVLDGTTRKDGKLPVNPSGGLKSKGHPIGATGVSMHVMAAMQLMGEAGDMQIANAALMGVFNMGGAAVTNYCSILERVK